MRCDAHLRCAGVETVSAAVGLRPSSWTLDHTASITCRHLPGFYTATRLHCLATEAHGCEQLAHTRYAAVRPADRGSNPRPLDRKSDTLMGGSRIFRNPSERASIEGVWAYWWIMTFERLSPAFGSRWGTKRHRNILTHMHNNNMK